MCTHVWPSHFYLKKGQQLKGKCVLTWLLLRLSIGSSIKARAEMVVSCKISKVGGPGVGNHHVIQSNVMCLESRFEGGFKYVLEGRTGRIQGMEGEVHEELFLWVVMEGRGSGVKHTERGNEYEGDATGTILDKHQKHSEKNDRERTNQCYVRL
jgi:hypothetical protein